MCTKVYEIVEREMNPRLMDPDGSVNCLFIDVAGVQELLSGMELTFAGGRYCRHYDAADIYPLWVESEQEAYEVVEEGNITVEMTYQDEFENAYYFSVRRREVW